MAAGIAPGVVRLPCELARASKWPFENSVDESRQECIHRSAMSIYVEIFIRGSMDELWQKTQEPAVHQRWDLRFSEIRYLARGEGEPQRFLYSTRIGAGLRIDGAGESIGERDDATGKRTSALKFWSGDPKSLIEAGSGYWQYVPGEGGIRFLTLYDYQARFGALGKLFDFVFRPLIGWATAWSFDRLRLWIEEGVTPEVCRNAAVVYCVARLTVAFVFFYHGLIPKLIYSSPDELDMLRNLGVQPYRLLTNVAGWMEIAFALLLIVWWRARWPLWLTIVGMVGATLSVAAGSPDYFHKAFDPLTLNLSVAALAACALAVEGNVPRAARCLRKPRKDNP
jgi:uncharacterized membrane protein YphA (DoxX/SURF4 family)